MLEDLDHLANRIQQLVQLAQSAQADQQHLAQRLAQSEAENRRLRGLLAAARDRVDDVLSRLPDPDAVGRNPESEQIADGTA